MNRRDFLSGSVSCGAHVFALACVAPNLMRSAFAASDATNVVAEEKWGRLEKIADGAWAVVSTPFETKDFTTVCNGGLIAGDRGVLAVESFVSPKGAGWLAEQAKRLTGRWPTDVVSTHYHADHTAGHRGYFSEGNEPRLWLTDATRAAAEASFNERGNADNAFANVSPLNTDEATTVDLGNRQVRLVPRSGHTASDVTVELVDPKVVWCGDLFFNRVFPNYSDATPSRLRAYAEELIAAPDALYIPGHGPVADVDALERYKEFLAFIGESAAAAFEAGTPVEEATRDYRLPERFSKWLVWSPQNAERAYAAWYRELEAGS